MLIFFGCTAGLIAVSAGIIAYRRKVGKTNG